MTLEPSIEEMQNASEELFFRLQKECENHRLGDVVAACMNIIDDAIEPLDDGHEFLQIFYDMLMQYGAIIKSRSKISIQ